MGNTWGIIQKGHVEPVGEGNGTAIDYKISNSDMAVSAFVAEF